MTNAKKTLLEYRINRAVETLDDAKLLFQNRKLFSCVNRIYYAIFYIVTALLFARDLSSTKHTGVLGIFNQEFVNKELVNKNWGRFYARMFEYRQKTDYKDFIELNYDDIARWVKQAEEFITEIKNIILSITK